MNHQDCINLSNYILNNTEYLSEINLNSVDDYINTKFEELTGLTLYNKSNIIEAINKTDTDKLALVKNYINKNYIPTVDYSKLFKSVLPFSLFFREDDIIILWNNSRISPSAYETIKNELISNHRDQLPTVYRVYVDNIVNVINKFITKNISVSFNCIGIPEHILKLFLIKCTKVGKQVSEEYKKYEDIVNGIAFKVTVLPIINNPNPDDDISSILIEIDKYEKGLTRTDKEQDDIHRMEVMSYLNDVEFEDFLSKLDSIEKFDKTKINDKNTLFGYTSMLLNYVRTSSNKVAKLYFVNIMFKYIQLNDKVITESTKNAVLDRIENLSSELYIIGSADLQLAKDARETFASCKKFLETLTC